MGPGLEDLSLDGSLESLTSASTDTTDAADEPSLILASPHSKRPVFCSQPKQAGIFLLDIDGKPSIWQDSSGKLIDSFLAPKESPSGVKSDPRLFRDSRHFEEHISHHPKPHTRIISIWSPNSIKPLGITESALGKLIAQYDIGLDILDIVQSFGHKPYSSEAGHGGMTVKRTDDGSYDMHYILTYAEDYVAGQNVKWTERQLGVFHRYVPSGAGNLWIFLHAQQQSGLQQKIEAKASTIADCSQFNWYNFHSLALSSYFKNWRWYIQSLGEEVEKIGDHVFVWDFSKPNGREVAAEKLFKLQNIRDKILPLSPRLYVMRTGLEKLRELNEHFRMEGHYSHRKANQIFDDIQYYWIRVNGHLQSLGVLERKIQGILSLLEVALDIGNQVTSTEINDKMLKMTTHTVHDSAAIRIITLVTLIYLPPSFVSTFLGMNLFSYGNNNSGFTISPQFWVFVVLAVPLTAITIISWYVFVRRRLRRRSRVHETTQFDDEKGGSVLNV
ncbi:hypothetical protein FQN50_007945 [Emmonsiellopsis sp. PD_5]|nr:hypothetical protein FQN50_007945 [Emmonsiellopsis sp. PD_5]